MFPESSVDSIRWVRHDSIILGCFQLTADGNEESYLVQVIKIKDGKFADVSNNFFKILSFNSKDFLSVPIYYF